MDWSYILFNSVVYGAIAFVVAWWYAYGKFLHLWIAAVMIAIGYAVQSMLVDGFSPSSLLFLLGVLVSFILVARLLVKYFPNVQQRDHVWLIFTLGYWMFLENMTSYLFWPSAVSVTSLWLPLRVLLFLFIGMLWSIWYIFDGSVQWKIWKWIYEKAYVIRSLWVSVMARRVVLCFSLFVLLAWVAYLLLQQSSIRPSDSLFYMIKWIGIMILVWVSNKQRIMIWALLYVLLEYLLFVTLSLPLMYKESFVLAIILLVLLIKPEWLFSWNKRKT